MYSRARDDRSTGSGRQRPTASSATSKIRVAELDGLRFIAALAVVLYHFTYRLDIPGVATTVFPTLGRAAMHGGMNLFFVISGFVILVAARDRSASDFVVSRIVRLYPEFWIGVILSAIAFSIAGSRAITFPQAIANLTMVPHLLGFDYVDGV